LTPEWPPPSSADDHPSYRLVSVNRRYDGDPR
jgi:hypothetical protein